MSHKDVALLRPLSFGWAYGIALVTFMVRWIRFWMRVLMYSVVAGYVAGLIAMVLYLFFQSDGLQHMVEALRFPTIEAAIAFFWFPIRLLTWLFGGITGVTMLVLGRRWRRMKC